MSIFDTVPMDLSDDIDPNIILDKIINKIERLYDVKEWIKTYAIELPSHNLCKDELIKIVLNHMIKKNLTTTDFILRTTGIKLA